MDYIFTIVAAAAILLISVVSFAAYGIDKRRAKRGQWRISEAFLLGIGFLGGAPGALLAMKTFRHKTKHWYFGVVNTLGLIWQLALLVFLTVSKL